MNATISKDFAFSAAHQLSGLAEHHPCGRVHGHNYTVRVTLTGPVDDVGMVVDYGRLKVFGEYLDDQFDHKFLNDVVTFNPTAENLATFLLSNVASEFSFSDKLDSISVSVSETPKTWATVTS